MFSRLKPFLFLAGLALLYFSPLLLHPTYVLYSDHSDFLATFLPVKRFLVRYWQQTGAVPLWCPYSFGGMPLIHDVQAAAFYPLHLPLYLLPEAWLGAAMSWLVVSHVFIAGACMLAYGRRQGLDAMPALVAAVGYMFAGKWLLHVLEAGHYVLIPLAWLPLVLLWLEQAMRRRSLLDATWAGIVFALIVLGTHPQMTFFAGLFIMLWTAACLATPTAEHTAQGAKPGGAEQAARGAKPESGEPKDGRASDRLRSARSAPRSWLFAWALFGSWTAIVAVGLSAVQLLPALEAAPESTRAEGVSASAALAVAAPALLGLVGPAWDGGWEDHGGLGLLWVAAALAAPLLYPGQLRFQAAVSLGLVAFAAGGAALLQWLPGFRLFQLPVRMLMLLALPVALLAGWTTQALLAETPTLACLRDWFRRLLFLVVAAGLVMTGCAAAMDYRAWQPVYWVVLLAAVTGALWLLGKNCPWRGRAWAAAWLALLLADSWGLTGTKVAVRSTEEIYAPSACVRYLAEVKARFSDPYWRVLDRGLPGRPSSAPLGAALPMFRDIEIEPVLGYNPFDLRRYKEFLQFIMDQDGPIRPREGIFGFPIVQGFPICNKSLLDLLGTRYVLEPAAGTSRFEAAGEPGKHPGWQSVGPEDPQPQVYSFLAGGVQQLPPYRIYENLEVLPRAFVVYQATPLADRSCLLAQMKATDFRREVLLEGPLAERDSASAPPVTEAGSATIRAHLPNRVVVEVQTASAGYLVLTDPWFPGWNCTVDGRPVPIQRADFLFRAVAIPAGRHDVHFMFQPASYRWGKAISVLTVMAVGGFSLLAGQRKRRARPPHAGTAAPRRSGAHDCEWTGQPARCPVPGLWPQTPTP